jgi:hypothetical protein
MPQNTSGDIKVSIHRSIAAVVDPVAFAEDPQKTTLRIKRKIAR